MMARGGDQDDFGPTAALLEGGARAVTCPLCGQPSTEFTLPISYGANGLPVEGAAAPGFGVAVLPAGAGIAVLLDGEYVKEAVAYSIPEGWVWAGVRAPDGNLVLRNGQCAMEKRCGVVAVEAMPR